MRRANTVLGVGLVPRQRLRVTGQAPQPGVVPTSPSDAAPRRWEGRWLASGTDAAPGKHRGIAAGGFQAQVVKQCRGDLALGPFAHEPVTLRSAWSAKGNTRQNGHRAVPCRRPSTRAVPAIASPRPDTPRTDSPCDGSRATSNWFPTPPTPRIVRTPTGSSPRCSSCLPARCRCS